MAAGGGGGGAWGTTFSAPTNSQYSGIQPTFQDIINQQLNQIDDQAAGQTLAQQNTAPASDPYAKWGGQDAYNNKVAGFDQLQNTAWSTALEAGDSTARNYNNSILDYIDSLRSGQSRIDLAGAKNELAKTQGQTGILGMVGRGIRSGGVMLANRNAGDSSAAGAIAAAYGDMGRRQMSNVGNQYEMGNQDIALQQADYDMQRASKSRDLELSKANAIDNITRDYVGQISSIDAQMVEADMPTRIALDQKKNELKQALIGKLAQYDQYLQAESAKINPASIEQRRSQAQGMATAGMELGKDAFNFTDQMPAQFQGTGPFASELPLFLQPRRRGE